MNVNGSFASPKLLVSQQTVSGHDPDNDASKRSVPASPNAQRSERKERRDHRGEAAREVPAAVVSHDVSNSPAPNEQEWQRRRRKGYTVCPTKATSL